MLIASTVLLTAIVFALPFILNKRWNGNLKAKRMIFAAYLGFVLILTIGIRQHEEIARLNMRLFQCYRGLANQISYKWRTYRFAYNPEQFRIISTGICNIAVNVVLFMPFGYLLPQLFPECKFQWWKILLLGITFTLLIEMTQLLTHRGCFDVDDLFHNSIGALLGYLVGQLVKDKHQTN